MSSSLWKTKTGINVRSKICQKAGFKRWPLLWMLNYFCCSLKTKRNKLPWHHYKTFDSTENFSLSEYEVHTKSFQTFFVWALLLIVHTWNSSPLRSNLLWMQCTCCTVPTTSGRPHGSPLVLACHWPSSQPLSFPQLSHNDSLWA